VAVQKPSGRTVATTSMSYVYKLLKSVAIAKVISQGTTERWVSTKSVALDIFYGFWKEKPGSEEVDVPRLKEVEPEVLTEFARLLKGYTDLTNQVLPQQAYLQRMVTIRAQLLDNLTSRIQGAQAVNRTVGREALAFAEELRTIVVVSTVALACCSFYIAIGALTGGTVLVLPCALGPIAVLPATATVVSGGMSAGGAAAAAGWLSAAGAAANAFTEAKMSAYIKVTVARATDVLGEKVPELVEHYDETIKGEKNIIAKAEEEITKAEEATGKIVRNFHSSRTALARTVAQNRRMINSADEVIAKKVAPWAAGAKFVPVLCSAYELQDSVGDLLKLADEKTVDE
jgi:hypothetical protein